MSKHTSHSVRTNSVAAHRTSRKALLRRSAQVLAVYKRARCPLREREVMQALGFMDMNAVRPTITALIDENVLREVGSRLDPVTGRTVRIVAAMGYDDPQRQLGFQTEKVEG